MLVIRIAINFVGCNRIVPPFLRRARRIFAETQSLCREYWNFIHRMHRTSKAQGILNIVCIFSSALPGLLISNTCASDFFSNLERNLIARAQNLALLHTICALQDGVDLLCCAGCADSAGNRVRMIARLVVNATFFARQVLLQILGMRRCYGALNTFFRN